MAEFDPRQAAARIDLANEPEFELGGLTVRPADLAIEKNGERHELQPQVMKVLVALARNRPAVMSRDNLIELCWDGRVVGDDSLYRCILALRHVARAFPQPTFVIETISRVGHRLIEFEPNAGRKMLPGLNRQVAIGILGVVAAALVAVTYYIGQPGPWPWQADKPAVTVLVAAGAGDTQSRTLARELAIELGSQGVNSASMRLVGEAAEAPVKSDLTVEVTRVADPTVFGATVALRASHDRSILWSDEFQEPSRSRGNLKHRVAMTTTRILSCAVEGMSSEDRLSEQTLKKYLTACAALSDSQYDVGKTVTLLEEVVGASPKFVGGWAKLLLAEAAVVTSDEHSAARRPSLAGHVASARRLQPELTEAYIANYILSPPNDFLTRYRLIDAAVARNPNHAQARIERAMFLQSVGRTNEGLRDAAQAVRLDPFSPAVRDSYIAMLAIAGRMDVASEELNRAEYLWPGAASLTWSRYRLHLRFGNPRVALQLLRSGAVDPPGGKIQEPFLQARIAPTVKNVERAIQAGRGESIEGHIQVLAEFDRKEELIQFLSNWKRMDKVDRITSVIFRPAFSELHRDPRFMRVADHLGLLEFWRTTGAWPDICFTPDLPYNCKQEAAQIAR